MLLVSGWIPLSKTIIPDAQEHFLTPSARPYTHLFGGLGLRPPPQRLTGRNSSGGTPGLLKKEIQRHTDVEGKFPNRRATRHSADAAPPEKDDDRAAAHRHLTNTNYLDT